MSQSISFKSYDRIILDRETTIDITKKTVRVTGNVLKTDSIASVYQTKNIASLGEGLIKQANIPWLIIISSFLIGTMIITQREEIGNTIDQEVITVGYVGIIILIPFMIGIVWNIFKPKHYGLLLTLNSGDKRLFVTEDKVGLQDVIDDIYDLIESDIDNISYQIVVENKEIHGNLIMGDEITGDKIMDDKVMGDKIQNI